MRRIWLALWMGALVAFGTAEARELRLEQSEVLQQVRQTPAGPLTLPADVAVGPDGGMYVVDGANHRVVALGSKGNFLFAFGGRGSAPGLLKDPVGIATDGSGRVYVADKGNGRIQVFDRKGTLERIIPVVDASGPVRPVGVVVSDSGDEVYVTGNVNHNVMVFGPDGKLLREWGSEGVRTGQFRYPATMALHEGLVYVVDVLNSRVQIFDGAGNYRFEVGEWGVLPGQLFRPKGIAIDGQGRIYVSDSYMNVIQVFDSNYRFTHVLGDGDEPRRFNAPGGLAIAAKSGRLYVAEMLSHRVSVLGLP